MRDIGKKGESYMQSKIKYTDEPMGKLKVVKDFLQESGGHNTY